MMPLKQVIIITYASGHPDMHHDMQMVSMRWSAGDASIVQAVYLLHYPIIGTLLQSAKGAELIDWPCANKVPCATFCTRLSELRPPFLHTAHGTFGALAVWYKKVNLKSVLAIELPSPFQVKSSEAQQKLVQ